MINFSFNFVVLKGDFEYFEKLCNFAQFHFVVSEKLKVKPQNQVLNACFKNLNVFGKFD